MSLAQDIVDDITAWAGDAEKIAASAASTLIPGLGTAEAALNALGGVAKLLTAWDADNNTPAMQNASAAQKLQAFKDRVNRDLVTGNEADLEKLEAP